MTEAESPGGKVEALKAAGVIEEGLPAEYHAVFEDLSNGELGVIMLLKARLDGVQRRVSDVEEYARFVPL
jgi:hypothetical protein